MSQTQQHNCVGIFSELLISPENFTFQRKLENRIQWTDQQKRFFVAKNKFLEHSWDFTLFSNDKNKLISQTGFCNRNDAVYAALQYLFPTDFEQEYATCSLKKFNLQEYDIFNPSHKKVGSIIGESTKWKYIFPDTNNDIDWNIFYDLGYSQLEVKTFPTRKQIVQVLHQVLSHHLFDFQKNHTTWWQGFLKSEVNIVDITC